MMIKKNGAETTPDRIEEDLRNERITPRQLRDSSWQVGELQTTLTLTYDGWTYTCTPHTDISEDVDWTRLYDWDWSVKYHELNIGHSTYELPEFDPPESVDCKRPSTSNLEAELRWEEIEFEDLLDTDEMFDVCEVYWDIDSCTECGCLNEYCVCETEEEDDE